MFVWNVGCPVNFVIGLQNFTVYFPGVFFLLRKKFWHIFVMFGIFWNKVWHILFLWSWQHWLGLGRPAVSEETRVGEVSSDRWCFPIFPVAWCWNGAWDWPTNVCKLQNVDQIGLRWIRLLNFGESVQCNLNHTCMLVCRLYLSDKDDSVSLCIWKMFSTYYFHVWNETERKLWRPGDGATWKKWLPLDGAHE